MTRGLCATQLAFALCVSITALSAQTQDDSTTYYYEYEPWPLPIHSSVLTAGVTVIILPSLLVEDEIPAPAFDLQYKYGIAEKATITASINTNIVANIAHVGAQWNDHTGNFSYAAGVSMVGFFGWLSIEGQFDNNWAYAVAASPLLRFGYRFNEFSVSGLFTVAYVLAAENRVSEFSIQGPVGTINDYYMKLAVEQPFLESMRVSLGLGITYSRTPVQAWIVANTIDVWVVLPEFCIGVQL